MASVGRIGRWLLIGGAGFLVLAVVLLGLGYGWAQSETGRAWIVRQASSALSTPGVSEVTIGRLEGSLPQALRIRDVAVADAGGTWLEVGSIAIDWRPWALTEGLLEVTDLSIEDLRVIRAPADAGDDTPAAGPPSLPVRVRVRRFAIADLELGPELLGTPARLAVAGGAQADEDGAIRAHLNITRTDGTPGRAEVRAAYRPGDDSLELTLGVSEPAGGLLARALGIKVLANEALPAFRADLAGSGPLSDWRGDFTASFEDLASLDLEIGLSLGAGIGFSLAGSAETLRPATDLPWTLLKGRIALAVEGAWQDDGVLNLTRVEVRTEAFDLALDGRLDTTAATLKAQARAVFGDPSLLEGVLAGARVADLTLALTAEGPLMQPDLRLEVSATGLALPEAEAAGLRAEVTFQPDGPLAGALSAAGRIETLALPGLPELASLLDGGLDWQFSGHVDLDKQRVSAEALSLETDAARISGSGVALLPEGRIDARFELALDELSRLAELTGLDLHGGFTLGGPLTIEQGGARVAADLVGALHGAGFGLSGLDEILAGDVELAAKLAWNETGLDLTEVSVKSALADLTAEAHFDPGFTRIEAAYSLSVAEAAALAPALGIGISGAARLEGRAEGAIGDPRLSGRLHLESLSHQGFALADLTADARVETVVSQPSGHLAASAGTPFGPVSLETSFAATAENLVLSGLRLASRDATLEGSARIPLDGGPPAADLRFRVPDLAPWLPLAGLAGRGSSTGTMTLAAEDGRETAALRAQFDGLDLKPGDGPPVGIEAASVRLRVTDPFAQPVATLSLEARGIAVDELRLDRLSADGRGTLEADRWAVDLTIGATGSWRGPLEIEAAGRIGRAGDTTTLDLTALEGRILGEPLRLQAPARLSAAADTFAVENLRLTYGTARLRLDARLSPAEIAVLLAAEEVPGPLLAPLWPAEISGILAAEVRIEGPRAAPTGQLTFGAVDVRVAGLDDVPPLAVSLTGDWKDGRLVLNGVARGASEADVRLSAELPLRLDPRSLSLSVPADEPIAADLAWRGEIARLVELAPLSDHVLTGTAEVRLKAAGTLANIRLGGALSIRDGHYENLVTGTLLENLALTVALDGEEARITAFEADDGRGGRLSADGSVRIDPAAGFPFRLETTLEQLFLVRRDEATASASGRLSLEGTLERAGLAGRIVTETVELRILDRLPPEVAVLDVVELDASGAPPGDAAEPGGGAFELDLDLVLDMPRKIFVRGRGLDSEWAGHLEITGTASDPRIAGQLSLVRGQISLVGKPFNLDRGVITFPEGDEIIPYIDMEAVNTRQGLTTTVRAVGPATKPKIELSSVPELPPDEILAQALFDKSSGQLDAAQAAQLAAAVAQLSGTGGSGADLFGTVRSTLGIDVLRVETVETADGTAPAATAGKYLTDEVFLDVTQGAGAETGSVGVEVELTPNISVESDVRQTGESSVGIKFKFDY